MCFYVYANLICVSCQYDVSSNLWSNVVAIGAQNACLMLQLIAKYDHSWCMTLCCIVDNNCYVLWCWCLSLYVGGSMLGWFYSFSVNITLRLTWIFACGVWPTLLGMRVTPTLVLPTQISSNEGNSLFSWHIAFEKLRRWGF